MARILPAVLVLIAALAIARELQATIRAEIKTDAVRVAGAGLRRMARAPAPGRMEWRL